MKIQSCSVRIKEAMQIKKIKQVALCELTGIPKSAMSQYVSGTISPKDDRLNLLARALGVSAAWLKGFDVPMQAEKISGLEIMHDNVHMAPLFESVAAGFGCYASDQVIDYVPLLIHNDADAEQTICIKVSGDSMYPKIENGDIIVVQKMDSVDSGSIGVFLIDDEEGVVKRANYVYGEDWLELISLNPDYMPRRFEGRDVERVKTLGLVKQVIKNI